MIILALYTQGLVIRKVNHALALQEAAATKRNAAKSSYAKRDIFSPKKILDHLRLHLEISNNITTTSSSEQHSDQLRPVKALSLYADEHIHTSDSTCVSTRAPASTGSKELSCLAGETHSINTLVNHQLPVALTTLVTRWGGEGATLFDVVVKSMARRLFYAGQVRRNVLVSCSLLLSPCFIVRMGLD